MRLETKRAVREFSSELHSLQRDMRILRAVKWPTGFAEKFLSQPRHPQKKSVHFSYMKRRKRFPLELKLKEIERLRNHVQKRFADELPDVAFIFQNILNDFENVARLLSSVGTPEFGQLSETLWGKLDEPLSEKGKSVVDLSETFGASLERMSDKENEQMFPKVLNAAGLASLLTQRLQDAHLTEAVEIIVTDRLIADAAAGKNYLKIRKKAKFSVKDVDALLYHEVFTHIATGLNGQSQPYAKWLAFDTPRCSSTQEGLAVFLEVLSGKTYPRRLRRIIDRILLLSQLQKGETPAQMYDWLREMRYSHRESLHLIMRAYRGCDPEARKPFTKDVSYLKGLFECFNFIQASLASRRPDFIGALYVGKLSLSEVPAIVRLQEHGLIKQAGWSPPNILDTDSLAGWFSYISALGGLRDLGLQRHFRKELAHPQRSHMFIPAT